MYEIMSAGQFAEPADGFGTLRQFARRERPLERCELCSAGLRTDHPHLIELAQRKLLCTCEACAILFSGQGVKFKRVPRRVRSLPGLQSQRRRVERPDGPHQHGVLLQEQP